ncbi:UNVERIFIED_CONTAM: hypothetical protein GTU68_013998, partial [Idotea baltica]|nr:hypothetical protein [Idotea baltica]
MSLISVERVSKIYSQGELEVRALDDVSLSIERGCFLTITGPSGSGKTTLLNLIGGLDTPTKGSISLDSKRIDKMTRPELAELRLANIGFVFQAYNLIPVLSALENVAFVMQLQGVPAVERNERAREVLADIGLSDKERSRPGQLSGGQQQRV